MKRLKPTSSLIKKTTGHPKASEQKVMADDLIAFIENNYWK